MKRLFSRIIFAATISLTASEGFAEPFAEVHKCDEYAAHPNDPNRWAKGVLDENIIPGPAVKFCHAAANDYQETPRFQFQLGRALWAAHKFEEGLQAFLKLEEATEYGPAYAYIGDAYMYGIGGVEEDQELAVSLYQIADDEGFAPASEVLAAIVGNTAPSDSPSIAQSEGVKQPLPDTTNQNVAVTNIPQQADIPVEQVKRFDEGIFFEKTVMRALNDGNVSSIKMGKVPYLNVDKSTFYYSGFLSQFQQNYNFLDADGSCLSLSNPRLVRILNTKAASSNPYTGMLVGNGRSLEQNLNAGGAMGWQMLGDMLKGMQSGRGVLGTDYGEAVAGSALAKENGEKDAARLIRNYGCRHESTLRIMANITYHITGNGEPQYSVEGRKKMIEVKERKARQEEEQQQKALRVSAQKSCVSQFKKDAYCGCLIEGLDARNIADDEWRRLGKSFKEVIAIGKAYDGFAGHLKSCRGKS